MKESDSSPLRNEFHGWGHDLCMNAVGLLKMCRVQRTNRCFNQTNCVHTLITTSTMKIISYIFTHFLLKMLSLLLLSMSATFFAPFNSLGQSQMPLHDKLRYSKEPVFMGDEHHYGQWVNRRTCSAHVNLCVCFMCCFRYTCVEPRWTVAHATTTTISMVGSNHIIS